MTGIPESEILNILFCAKFPLTHKHATLCTCQLGIHYTKQFSKLQYIQSMVFSWPFPKGPAKKHCLYFLSLNLIFEVFILFTFQCFHQYTYISVISIKRLSLAEFWD